MGTRMCLDLQTPGHCYLAPDGADAVTTENESTVASVLPGFSSRLCERGLIR